MKNYNKNLLLILSGVILLILILMAIMPQAEAHSNDVYIECGQEYILVEREDGYKDFEAWMTWEDNWRGTELVSMVAKYWNGIKTINSKIGFSDQRESMFSPLTCEQLESKKFGTFISIPAEEVEVIEIDTEKEELKKEINQALYWIEELQNKLNNL